MTVELSDKHSAKKGCSLRHDVVILELEEVGLTHRGVGRAAKFDDNCVKHKTQRQDLGEVPKCVRLNVSTTHRRPLYAASEHTDTSVRDNFLLQQREDITDRAVLVTVKLSPQRFTANGNTEERRDGKPWRNPIIQWGTTHESVANATPANEHT